MKLLDRVRHALRAKHFSYRTEQCYVHWIERFIRFHGIRHPDTMGLTVSPTSRFALLRRTTNSGIGPVDRGHWRIGIPTSAKTLMFPKHYRGIIVQKSRWNVAALGG